MKTNLLKLKRAFSYVLFVLLTGILAIAKANPQSNNQILNETFESYTVGNKIASEANLAGNNWWTTWSSDPGSSEDGVVAEYNDTKCGFVSGSTDQVILFGGYEEGIFNLELDVLIPNEKTGYFNILHSFSGGSSKWALEAYLHYQGNESNPYHGLIMVGGSFNGDAPVVYDEWMHFRININMGTDVAILYYSSESTYTEEQQICQWQWSTNAGGDTYGPKLDGMDFFCPLNTSEFYIDNISLSYDDSYIPTTPIIDGIKYSINEDGTSVTVEGLAPNTTASGDLNIPATITFNETQYDVTKIASEAFSNTGFNGTLTLPSSITFIGESAFYHSCFNTLNYNIANLEYDEDDYYGGPFYGLSNSLTTLNIGDNVETIPANMFNFFTSLTGTLTIPESMTSIGRNAFYRTAFTTINYNAINCEMGAQFDEWENTYTYECVFGWCQNLETLNIGENVQTISPSAFNVDGFTGDLVIPSSVTAIGANAFKETHFDGSLTIPENVTTIGRGAFYNTLFTTINYNAINCVMGAQFDEWENTYTYECVFGWCQNLETLYIGENVQTISPKAFNVNGFTGNLVIPNSVTTIGANAFNNTNFNGTLTIPENVTTIGRGAFYNTLFTTINYNAINCVMGEEVDWYDNPSYECVFRQCEYLETLYIGENVQVISPKAFNVNGFTGNLVIPNSVTTIGDEAFSGTNFNGALTIPENITTIGRDAFYETGFTTINYNAIDCVMGEGVDWYDNPSYECVFRQCEYLETLYIGENVQTISPKAFNVNGFTGNLVIPNSVTTIGANAFNNTNFNGTLTIPENVTTIGRGAFYNTLFTTINYNAINCVMGEEVDWYDNPSYECVFRQCEYLETLYIGENVQVISPYAFCVDGFTGDLIIPNSVTTIGDYAFSGTGFTGDLVIPNSVTTIGTSAFYNAGFNGALTIPENIATIGREAFGETGFITINYNAINCVMGEGVDWENNVSYECVFGSWYGSPLETLNIGENVQVIPINAFAVENAFSGDLVIPNSVTMIGSAAFYNTGFNGTLTMSNAVTSIGAYAFYNTQFSGTLTIPSSVTHIGSGAFYGTGFTTLNYNIPNYDEEITSSYYDGPFSGMNSLTTLNIGNNVEVIPNNIFGQMTALTGELIIPNSVTYIGNSAFAGDGFNGSLVIPNSVTYIGESAFQYTGFDGTLTLGNSVTTIGANAFAGVSFTGDLEIPNSVLTISDGAFTMDSYYGSNSFDGNLTIGNSVTIIGEYAFARTNFTGDLVIPNSVITIGDNAFSYCQGFTGSLTIGNAVTTIGASAFNSCYGFSENLIMGSSVETIGSNAFYGCGGFKGEITLPATVNYIGDAAFRSCDEITKINYNATNCTYMGNSNSPVFYDCVSISQINIGENVESIPNYAFKRCSNVTAMNVAAGVPPTIGSSTFGTVSRSIPVSVPYGTREAYRTAPYWSEFLNIHDDYTPTQYDYYWTVDVNQFSSDMTIIGVIQINGVEQENPALEIGAFCGTECRGRQMLTYYSQIDRYQVLLMLYGEDGDVLSFRLYNHENEEELLLGSENEITFETNASLGLPLNPYVFNFISMQTTALNSGWSWYSSYIEQGGIDGLEMIENSLGEAGLMIQSRNNGYVEAFDYNNSVVWYGTLNAIENEQMYKVHTNASCNVVMIGVSATMSNHPITINSGWNWIGFPSGRNLNLNTALSGMTPEINDIIKGRNGYATYVSYNENNTWYGTLNVLESGQGYMYLSNSETPKTLVYQTGRDAELFNNITADGNIYKPVSERFADNMTITAIVDMDDVELKSESYEIAAFVGDECRGSVKLMYVEPFDRYVAFLTVFGEQSEEMRFVLTNNNDVFSSTEHISFINDGVVGTLTEPAIIHFGTMNLVDENNQTVSVYPNPTNGVFNVYCNGIKRIEVINTVGQLVKDMNVSDDSVAIDLSNEKAGVYMLRVITDNEIIVKRIIKE